MLLERSKFNFEFVHFDQIEFKLFITLAILWRKHQVDFYLVLSSHGNRFQYLLSWNVLFGKVPETNKSKGKR